MATWTSALVSSVTSSAIRTIIAGSMSYAVFPIRRSPPRCSSTRRYLMLLFLSDGVAKVLFSFGLFHHFFGKIIFAFFQSLADFVTDELVHLCAGLRQQFFNCDLRIFNKRLAQQGNFLFKLGYASG